MSRSPDDQRRIDLALARLALAWRTDMDDAGFELYNEVLGDCTAEEIERVCKGAMRGEDGFERMPAAGSLRQGVTADRQRRARLGPQVALPLERRDQSAEWERFRKLAIEKCGKDPAEILAGKKFK